MTNHPLLGTMIGDAALTRLQKEFADGCGICVQLLDPHGAPLTGGEIPQPCHRLLPAKQRDEYNCPLSKAELLAAAAEKGDVASHICPIGLVEAAAPISPAGRILGFAVVGPARIIEPDPEQVVLRAEQTGQDPGALANGLAALPLVERDRPAAAALLLRYLIETMAAAAAVRLQSLDWPPELARDAELLRRDDSFYLNVLEGLHEGLIFQAADGHILFWNRAAEEIFGVSRDQALGRTSLDADWRTFHQDGTIWPGEEHPSMVTLATGRALNDVRMGIRRPGGELRRLSINTRPLVRNGEDKPFAVVITFGDVTQRQRAEEALSKTVTTLRDTLESISDGFFALDENLVFTYFNAAASRLLKRPVGEVLGKSLTEAFPETVGSVFEAKYTEAIREKKRMTFEVYFDIEPYVDWYDVRVYPQKDGISVYFRLTTEEKRTREALVQSERRHRRLLEFLPDPVVVYDMEGRANFVNPAFERTFGWRSEEVLGRRLAFVPPEYRSQAREAIAAMRNGVQTGIMETKRLTKGGDLLDVQLTSAILLDADGAPEGNVVILRDVSRERRAAEERRRLEVQLRQAQKMEAVGTLAGGIAHDFNNILGAVMGYAELALDSQRQGRGCGDELNQILDAAERARALVRQILTFSRKLDVELKPMDLKGAVERAVKFLESTIPRMIRVEMRLDENLWPVLGDANQIEQLILNLGSNAMDAMPNGGRLEITAGNHQQEAQTGPTGPELPSGPYVHLTFTDTGQGMDPATLRHIFDPFFTTKEVGKGTGLGLSTVFGIVTGHGGHVTCASRPGAGTSFDIFLPGLPRGRVEPGQAAADQAQAPRGSETILVVDDEAALRDLARRILSRHGYKVILAATGEEGLEAFAKADGGVDLVLLDMSMPGMGGYRCFRELRALDPGARVVLASGYLVGRELNELMESGAMGFLSKPFKSSDLLTVLREALDNGG